MLAQSLTSARCYAFRNEQFGATAKSGLAPVPDALILGNMKALHLLQRPSRSKFVTSIHSAIGRWSAGAPHLSTKPAPPSVLGHPPDALRAFTSLVLLSVLCGFAASAADAQSRTIGSGFRHRPLPPPVADGFVGFPGVWVVERVHVIEREVIKEVPAPPPPEPPPPPRKPYVIGASYDTLPSGCMKMIEGGASYYLCSGEWYRQVGSGSAVEYKAIAAP